MPTTYANLNLVVPDIGTTPWYTNLLDWLAKIDTFAGGHWEPLTNLDPVSPELVFADDGSVVMVFVEG